MTVRAMAADRTKRKSAQYIYLVDKIAVRGQKLPFARASVRTPFWNSTGQTMSAYKYKF